MDTPSNLILVRLLQVETKGVYRAKRSETLYLCNLCLL